MTLPSFPELEKLGTIPRIPDIYKRRSVGSPDITQELNVRIYDWVDLENHREYDLIAPQGGIVPKKANRSAGRLGRNAKGKATSSGRTYTSKFRGVHQTFPTRRWEAQFRRNGKPTSLGCFDREEEAARAYDKMMLWCELHNASGVKGGITNFDPTEYEADIPLLQQISQDELVAILRSDGRRQAQQRVYKPSTKKEHRHTPSGGGAGGSLIPSSANVSSGMNVDGMDTGGDVSDGDTERERERERDLHAERMNSD